MRIDIKIRLEDWMVQAIDEARVRPSAARVGFVIDSRAEMIRRLIAEALRAREAAKPVPEKIAESKKRAAESRERVSRRANVAASTRAQK